MVCLFILFRNGGKEEFNFRNMQSETLTIRTKGKLKEKIKKIVKRKKQTVTQFVNDALWREVDLEERKQ